MKQHEYLVEVEKYFGGKVRGQVTAFSKEEARDLALELFKRLYGRDNIIKESVRVVRKLKPSFGTES